MKPYDFSNQGNITSFMKNVMLFDGCLKPPCLELKI